MGKIYKGQFNLSLTLQTGVTVTGATATLIKYIKPDGTTGNFVADITGTEDIIYNFTAADELDIVGDWTFWVHVTFSDSRVAQGEPVVIRVYAEGN